MEYQHEPVLLAEVLAHLDLKIGGKYIDCTLGGASYTLAIAQAIGEGGEVMSFDLDPQAIQHAQGLVRARKLNNVILKNSNFTKINQLAQEHWGIDVKIDGLVMDLGLSSYHLSDKSRGFSFLSDRSVDMSFGPEIENSTLEIINHYSERELAEIFQIYGDEPRANYLAKVIVQGRKKEAIVSAKQLADLINSVSPRRFYQRLHPATKVFQALRMETNQELENLRLALPQASNLLVRNGILAVVSFHSGEDRIVKHFFRDADELEIVTKKPVIASTEEIANNPRSRSAKLRVAKKI